MSIHVFMSLWHTMLWLVLLCFVKLLLRSPAMFYNRLSSWRCFGTITLLREKAVSKPRYAERTDSLLLTQGYQCRTWTTFRQEFRLETAAAVRKICNLLSDWTKIRMRNLTYLIQYYFSVRTHTNVPNMNICTY